MNEEKKKSDKDQKATNPPAKPKKPGAEGAPAPDDKDPNAQYDDKDES